MHFVEKGANSTFGHCPDPRYTYELTKAGFAGKEVWVIPEYDGNLNLTKRMEWFAENFTGIPVVIDVFEGGNNTSPNVMLTIADLEQIMSVANVTAIRFPEVISWYMSANETSPVDFPNMYVWVHDMMDFALNKNLKIYWSEWKLGDDIEELTNETLAGYEDKITYLYQTNNQYQHPLIGYSYAHELPHWGASVQSWYVDDQDEDIWDLPVDIVAKYAMLARNMGAETIEFEPYWYFIEYGVPLEPIQIMWSII
jgi:hypothetical protein